MNAICRVQSQEPNVPLSYGVVEPTTRSGRVRRDPPGYPERLREVAPGRAQVSGPVDRVSAFHYRLKVTHGQGLGKETGRADP